MLLLCYLPNTLFSNVLNAIELHFSCQITVFLSFYLFSDLTFYYLVLVSLIPCELFSLCLWGVLSWNASSRLQLDLLINKALPQPLPRTGITRIYYTWLFLDALGLKLTYLCLSYNHILDYPTASSSIWHFLHCFSFFYSTLFWYFSIIFQL